MLLRTQPINSLSYQSLLLTAFIALFLFIVPSVMVSFLFGLYAEHKQIANPKVWLGQIETLVAMTFAIYFVVLPFVYIATRSLSPDGRILSYLHITAHPFRFILKIKVMTLIFWLMFTGLGLALDIPSEPFMQQLKHSTVPLWFVFLSVCVMAPLVEEVVFRGFLFKRIELTKLGCPGAAMLTSALFAVIHSQYSVVGVVMVFILGLYFTWLRIKYSSTSAAIIAHSVCNTLTLCALYWLD